MKPYPRSALVLNPLHGMPLIKEGDDLAGFLQEALRENGIVLQEGDILVLAQKIVSKAEGRIVHLMTIQPSKSAEILAEAAHKDPREVELILRESSEVLRSRPGLIIVQHRLGFVCANAGIDRSNVSEKGDNEEILLLPENPDQSAAQIRTAIQERTGQQIGVLIIDSHGRAWRKGTVGISIGFSGIPGIVDFRGKPDLFNYKLQITEVAAVDELAAGASLVMGQSNEGIPAVHARGFPYQLREGDLRELPREMDSDLFR